MLKVWLWKSMTLKPWLWQGIHILKVTGLQVSVEGVTTLNLTDLCQWFGGLQDVSSRSIRCANTEQLKSFHLLLTALQAKSLNFFKLPEECLKDKKWYEEMRAAIGKSALSLFSNEAPGYFVQHDVGITTGIAQNLLSWLPNHQGKDKTI